MSKVSQELKVLLMLNDTFHRTRPLTVKEVADRLDCSTRQARRYFDDLMHESGYALSSIKGRYGGYRLEKQLQANLLLPENMVLVLEIAMRRNQKVESVLLEMSNCFVSTPIEEDGRISDQLVDKLMVIIKAIKDEKELGFIYTKYNKQCLAEPYKVRYTNHTYYLYLVENDVIKKYDVAYMEDIKILGRFHLSQQYLDEILNHIASYGIRAGQEGCLKVKCVDKQALMTFDKYYDGRGKMDEKCLIYEVESKDEHELYYPLFRISTKIYEFVDERFKERYLAYLHRVIKSIERR